MVLGSLGYRLELPWQQVEALVGEKEFRSADLFLATFSAHADGERRRPDRIGGWRRKGLG